MRGEYREVAPPERLVNTESWGGVWPETVNTVAFDEQDEKTTVTLTVLYPSQEAREAATATGMESGMNHSFDLLDGYLASITSKE
jgi:uncharacterized protein YndB with AHSA1/START domain